jgi:5'-deoxynucleotidase YfbR-like HD superfamily hydrolase
MADVDDTRPNFLKAAFLNVYNLSLLGGAGLVALATQDWLVGIGALGLEALWLVIGPDLKPFQRAVREAARVEREKAETARVEQMLAQLTGRDFQRARALQDLKREIERDIANNPSFSAILLRTELEKLGQLYQSFVKLSAACQKSEGYLGTVSEKELTQQLEAQASLERNHSDAALVALAQKNGHVLQKRLDAVRDIRTFLQRARGQMNLIENSVRLLRDQALTMTSPSQLTEQLDGLLMSVDAVSESVKDTDAILAGRFDPVVPIGEGDGPNALQRARERQ